MTEIVADKTVEVVKNAIETADGALDLYNKYLDQVIPWQTFERSRSAKDWALWVEDQVYAL